MGVELKPWLCTNKVLFFFEEAVMASTKWEVIAQLGNEK